MLSVEIVYACVHCTTQSLPYNINGLSITATGNCKATVKCNKSGKPFSSKGRIAEQNQKGSLNKYPTIIGTAFIQAVGKVSPRSPTAIDISAHPFLILTMLGLF